MREQKRLRRSQHPGASGKGEGKGKKGKDGRRGMLPAQLIGMESRVNGQNPCYSFNISGCNLPVTNGRCRNGVHLCMRRGCGGAHGALDPAHHP
eukprot:649892-Karenia_brevis.AAC.1